MLILNQLIKKYGDFTAVDNLSLHVNEGEFFGFLGPNGAGKTTTIKMITGLLLPTAGTIFLNGIDLINNDIEGKKIIGYVPDQPFLYDRLTGREFLYFSGGLYGIKKKELTEIIKELIGILQINDWIDKRTEDYSQGMKQRVAIASALLHNPRLIVIDEPMIGLDPQTAHIVKRLLKEKTKEGVSVFMSTHSLSVAEELCDKVAIIKNGKIIFEDDMQKLQKFKDQKHSSFESLFIELTK